MATVLMAIAALFQLPLQVLLLRAGDSLDAMAGTRLSSMAANGHARCEHPQLSPTMPHFTPISVNDVI